MYMIVDRSFLGSHRAMQIHGVFITWFVACALATELHGWLLEARNHLFLGNVSPALTPKPVI